MRLTKLKIAGFKSFVDPTSITFPSSLTGVVGPNGCGKSNIIDAVRWVMGEISAKHLRGDSMADVIFNGSSARKPLGTASVEMVFDNSDGKIGGAYANYNEVALRRAVSRDGTSDYFINGVKVRRKDITQLFLGTGLGTRSYAIIEQGMISRIIDARPDDLRAFLEEAAGVSRYKERRRETENRIASTRENLDRLNDLREEVDKQIRHLQRQAATARRYQTLKEEERKLTAELLALRLQSLDHDIGVRDAATQRCDTQLQATIANLRAAEAEIERIRVDQTAKTEVLTTIQAHYYGAGGEVTRIEQSIQHARELRQRQQSELDQAQTQVQGLTATLLRDQSQIQSLSAELDHMGPELDLAHAKEADIASLLERCELAINNWQQQWHSHTEAAALAQRETQVERARIEQLENQQRRLLQEHDRQQVEHDTLVHNIPSVALETLSDQATIAHDAGLRSSKSLQELLAEFAQLRTEEREQAQALNTLRGAWQSALGTQVSTEALQQAALGKASGKVSHWLKAQSLDHLPRVAQQLRVDRGWERAVETVLGSYLEAVCVDGLDSVTDALTSFDGGQLAIVSVSEMEAANLDTNALQAKVQGATILGSIMATVYTAETLGEALGRRRQLKAGESVVTRDGVWLGRDWLRLSRDQDAHAGVIEREETLRKVRVSVTKLAGEVQELEQKLDMTRERVREYEDRREHLQTEVNRLHREHVDRRGEFDAAHARKEDGARRLSVLSTGLADVATELNRTETELRLARSRMEIAIEALVTLEPLRLELEQERDRVRAEQSATRLTATGAQAIARELGLQVQSRRSSHASLMTSLVRIQTQVDSFVVRRDELATQLASVDALGALQSQLDQALQVRLRFEMELQAARMASDELDATLRGRDEHRLATELQVNAARKSMDDARLAAEQVRARRESIAEQMLATGFELTVLMAQMVPEANAEAWDANLAETRGKIERLGQVNLAAIGEFKEQSERKEYLDRQCKDLTDALETLESAMRKIDRETRTRFQDTFDKVNAGLKEKFPRLFGGGHAYLELTGEESSVAGVSVMARPPGKRNSTISQLSGGEKALTAVALVFAIFDLNPAPFCLLDEVDAPLDENNVSRFCDIVREMSSSVQFIFITHNKSTMELASQLVGVTMNEPGVSRLVAVDVDEAVRMAAM